MPSRCVHYSPAVVVARQCMSLVPRRSALPANVSEASLCNAVRTSLSCLMLTCRVTNPMAGCSPRAASGGTGSGSSCHCDGRGGCRRGCTGAGECFTKPPMQMSADVHPFGIRKCADGPTHSTSVVDSKKLVVQAARNVFMAALLQASAAEEACQAATAQAAQATSAAASATAAARHADAQRTQACASPTAMPVPSSISVRCLLTLHGDTKGQSEEVVCRDAWISSWLVVFHRRQKTAGLRRQSWTRCRPSTTPCSAM